MKKKNKRLFILIAIIICLLLLISIGACTLLKDDKQNKRILNHSENEVDASDPNLESHGQDDYFEILGYGQLEIDKNYPNINLINSSENNVYLSFDVLYNEQTLYHTGLISPGKMEQYDVYSNLDAGQHTLTYSIDVYDMNENILWSGIQQKQDILIKE